MLPSCHGQDSVLRFLWVPLGQEEVHSFGWELRISFHFSDTTTKQSDESPEAKQEAGVYGS